MSRCAQEKWLRYGGAQHPANPTYMTDNLSCAQVAVDAGDRARALGEVSEPAYPTCMTQNLSCALVAADACVRARALGEVRELTLPYLHDR